MKILCKVCNNKIIQENPGQQNLDIGLGHEKWNVKEQVSGNGITTLKDLIYFWH